ncbi:MAG: hypothetical protein U0Q19_17030 [Kineosporiaceae bacterium]
MSDVAVGIGALSTRAIADRVGASSSYVQRTMRTRSVDLPEYVTGLDGKIYPARRQPDRLALIEVVHRLSHAGLSVRGVIGYLADVGVRRSVGTVSTWLRDWRCNDCSGDDTAPPEQVRHRHAQGGRS